jgi:RecB family endonuclease NucS
MPIAQLSSPSPDEVVDAVKAAVRDRGMLTVQARCEVEYEGRTAGHLGPGDRVVMAKPDGTFLVHRPTNHKPVNWMPEGSLSARVSDGDAVLVAHRTDPTERVRVRVLEAYGLARFDADDGATYRESGTEAEMHSYIENNPGELEAGLRIVEHERETKYGFVDFYAVDAEGVPVVIEVKRIQATLNHVDQLKRYVGLYEEGGASLTPRGGGEAAETNDDVRGMLVAPSASERVERTLSDAGLEFVALPEFDVDDTGSREAKLSEF